jgi:hypothetical protein
MRFLVVFLAVGCAIPIVVAQQAPKKIPRLTTLTGATYTDVTLGESEVAGLHIKHRTGAATIPWS